MGRDSILKVKSFAFAIRIVRLYQFLKHQHKEFELSAQLLKAGTAIGALVREAEYAESRNDFIHKLAIALKEANECVYWLDLLFATGYLDERMYNSIVADGIELLKILISSVKTSRIAGGHDPK